MASARFVVSAFHPDQEPRDRDAAVLFVGRSNVGKSSLINRLLGVRGLAKTSSTPGRTQSVNFYRIDERYWFVDLPGYGYAKVPAEVRRNWRPMIEGFLRRVRDRARLVVMLVDARHGATDLDRTMHSWLIASGIPTVVAATKADKLTASARARVLGALTESLDFEPGDSSAVVVSSTTGLGIRDLHGRIRAALEAGS